MVKVLALETSVCQHLSGHSIEGSNIELLIKSTEWEALNSAFMLELCITAQHSCPVEALIQVCNVMLVVGKLQVPMGIKAEKSILI